MVSEEGACPDTTVSPVGGIPRWIALVLGALSVMVLIALWLSVKARNSAQSSFHQLSDQSQAANLRSERLTDVLAGRLAEVEQQNASLRGEVEVLNGELHSAKGNIESAQKQVQHLRDQDRNQIQRLLVMNGEVRNQLATRASAEDLKTIGANVDSVRDAIRATKDDFKMNRMEVGSLIARNHDEIEMLRQRGDRDYFEFTISGKNASEKMGDITLTLRGTDPKKNEYSLELLADDKTTQKHNRTINEPIFFYREREAAPSEIVINDVRRNEVIGYLSVPKQKTAFTVVGNNPN